MNPEIEAYVREHGSRYTTEALRRRLIRAGHDPDEVDAALAQTQAIRAQQLGETRALRSRFWLWAIAVNVAGLILATIWAFGGANAAYAGAVPMVLGFFMLIGLAISGLIGSALLGRGLGVALLVPVIVSVVLTGSCMAMFGARAATI